MVEEMQDECRGGERGGICEVVIDFGWVCAIVRMELRCGAAGSTQVIKSDVGSQDIFRVRVLAPMSGSAV